MSLTLTVASERYDRIQPLLDGRVRIEGCATTFFPLSAEECFHRAFNGADFDVTELSGSSYLMTHARGDCPYIAVPVFLSKLFRHSAIYVRPGAGITGPQDLKGRRVGLPEYQMTACLWARGILQHEYGVHPRDIAWFTGGQEQPGRKERARLQVDPEVSITRIGEDETLVQRFLDGQLDALITARVPSVHAKDPAAAPRLFADYRKVEEDYFRKTGIFPIMHFTGIRRTLADAHPWLAASVTKAFAEAKAITMHELDEAGYNFATLPFVLDEVRKARALFGQDYWTYGVAPNRAALTMMARFAHEQGMVDRLLSPEELFHPATLEMSAI